MGAARVAMARYRSMSVWRIDVGVATWKRGDLGARCKCDDREGIELWKLEARCRRADVEGP